MLQIITDILSKSFTDDNVSSDILRISDIPSEVYRKTLLQELISSQFFESSDGAHSIFNFLASLTKFYTESQTYHDPLMTFYFETLDMLLRRSLSNFSEDKTQNVFICNNYSLQLETSLPSVKLLWIHITSDSGSKAIFDDLLVQLNKENGKSVPLSLLQTIVSFSCLSLSYSLSRLSDPDSKEESNHSNRFLEILRAISGSLDRLKIINEQHVFDEWLANFLVEIYRVFEVAKKTKQDKTIDDNIFEQLCKSLFSNEDLINPYKILNFLCGRGYQDNEKVKTLLDRKYKAYIITYSLAIEIEYYIITEQEIIDKKIPAFLQNINKLCIVFQRTPKPEHKPYKTNKTRGKQFEDVLGKVIRTIISRSNDENGFVVMRAIVDYIELITHINKSKATQSKGQLIFTRKRNSENEILEVLGRGIFGYKMLLSALEWSIDAIIDFLLENYAFLELLFKVLKQFTSCHKTDVLGWLTDIELNRIEFFTDELMKRLMEYKNQFSFNVSPLISLLKQVIELCKNDT